MKKLFFAAAAALMLAAPANAQKFGELAQTPPMGWNSWNHFKANINETNIKEMADAMVEKGLLAAGYEYLNLDDLWHGERDVNGFITCDAKKFPSGMKALADYVHAKGLKFGIYSDAGTHTCAKQPGSLGHEYQDALQYARWGVDYLKYDWCNNMGINYLPAYTLMRDALYAAGRPIVFSICEWGDHKPWEWGQDIGHLWRTTGDIVAEFRNDGPHGGRTVLEIIDLNAPLRAAAGPGHWNDPDMLEVGNGLTDTQGRSHFTLWCMMAAPLMLGNDVRTMSDATIATLTNRDVIAIDQDPLGVQGLRYKTEGDVEVWFKPLKDGDWALCLFNRGQKDATYSIDWKSLDFTDDLSGRATQLASTTYSLKNLWTGKADGNTLKNRTVTIPAEDVVLYRMTPAKAKAAKKSKKK